MKKKFYYLIEDIDINGDNNADGFIITKYKITSKTNDKIFLQTKYFSIEDFQKKMLAIRLKQDIAKLKKILQYLKREDLWKDTLMLNWKSCLSVHNR